MLESDLDEKLRRLNGFRSGVAPTTSRPTQVPLGGRHFLEAFLKSWKRADCRRLQRELGLSDDQRIRIERLLISSSGLIWRQVYAERSDVEMLLRAAETEREFARGFLDILTESQRISLPTRWDPHWCVLASDRPEEVRKTLAAVEFSDQEREAALDEVRTWSIANELSFARYAEMGEPPEVFERRRNTLRERTLERLKDRVAPNKLLALEELLREEER